MTDPATAAGTAAIAITMAGLALGTISIRLVGVALGRSLPQRGPWARGLKALPGCLIISLVTVLLVQNGPQEWIAALVALVVACLTRSLPITMLCGIAAIYALRHSGLFL